MILVIAGTDRVGSNTGKIARAVKSLLEVHGEEIQLLDLADLKPASHNGPHYGIEAPENLAKAVAMVNRADGVYVVVPEYNGSMPGALKYFIDHWTYPKSFEFRPFAISGLGGMFGGLRPVEHLQGVLGFRNAFIYPERVFVRDAGKLLKGVNDISDPLLLELFKKQAEGFVAFVKALKAAGLDANSRKK